VAAVTIGRIQRVVVAHMARRARRWRRRRVCPGQGESSDAVVERRGVPSHCRVACRTVGRSKCTSGSGVNRIVGLLPGGQMALRISAIRWCNRQCIVVIDVAQGARYASVSVCQRKSCRVVIEHSRRPRRNRVASGACRCGRREACRDVIRNAAANRRGALECSRMASVAIG